MLIQVVSFELTWSNASLGYFFFCCWPTVKIWSPRNTHKMVCLLTEIILFSELHVHL